MRFHRVCFNCGELHILKMSHCPVCNSIFYKLSWRDGRKLSKMETNIQRRQWVESQLGHPIPEELNILWENYRQKELEEYRKEKIAEIYAYSERGKAILEGKDKGNQFGISCPYCHATNVRKISVASKAAHTAVFGVYSVSRNSKQWHCTHCGSDF